MSRKQHRRYRWMIGMACLIPFAPAYAGFETILGNVDGVFQQGTGDMVVRGWACWTYANGASPKVDLYVGGDRDHGGTKIGTFASDQPNELEVDQVCGTQNIAHRFIITLNIAVRQQYAGQPIYVYGVPWVPSASYVLLNGSGQYRVPDAPAVSDSVYYIQTDRLGSNVIMTDDKANVVAKTDYKAYGAAADNQQKNEAPGYTGHYEDPLTGLTYMQQRYYDSDLGRFISTDPVASRPGDVFNFNRYAYANNNPLSFVDPDGQDVGNSAPINVQGYYLRRTFYNDGRGGWGGVSFGRGGGSMAGGAGGGGGIRTEKPVNVTADREPDPVVPSDGLRADQRWYCTPGAASVAGSTAGGIVAGGLTAAMNLRGNPYAIAGGAVLGGVFGGGAQAFKNELTPYLGDTSSSMISNALASAILDRNPGAVAVNGWAAYFGSKLELPNNAITHMLSRSVPYTLVATVGTAPAVGKGALVAGPMIGLASGLTDFSFEAGWNNFCGNR